MIPPINNPDGFWGKFEKWPGIRTNFIFLKVPGPLVRTENISQDILARFGILSKSCDAYFKHFSNILYDSSNFQLEVHACLAISLSTTGTGSYHDFQTHPGQFLQLWSIKVFTLLDHKTSFQQFEHGPTTSTVLKLSAELLPQDLSRLRTL